jgi:putative ABC transport system permease protein
MEDVEIAGCNSAERTIIIHFKTNYMFRHLFKLIWNKKKQNALLITEMFISFLVMFAIFTMVVFSYENYRQAMGFDYDNVWSINYTPPENITSNDSAIMFQEALKNTVRSMPQVSGVSFCGNNIPFSMNSSNTMVDFEKKKRSMTNIYNAEEDYLEVLNIKLKSGRWIKKADAASKTKVAVITSQLEDELFDGKSAIGKKVSDDWSVMEVVGVIENIKDKGDYHAIESGLYKPIDTSSARWTSTMLLKVKPGADAAFESRLFKTLSNANGRDIEIEHLDKKLVTRNNVMLVPMIIAFIVAGFLIINVALGLFGVLWYNINKRRGEIGLRRAVGAPGKSISSQLVGEALVLSTISLLLGCFFAVQFPLLNVFDLAAGTYITAIILSILFIYVLVMVCAFYPGKQAAAIYPAVALHEE